MINPFELKKFIQSIVRDEQASRPNVAKVVAVDGNSVDIQISGSASTIKNVNVSGDPAAIVSGETYVVQWEKEASSTGYVPIIIAPAFVTEASTAVAGGTGFDLSAGGWSMEGDGSLKGGSIIISPSGSIVAGLGSDTAIVSSKDATYRLWAGAILGADAPFSVSKAGAVKATSGTIGGWTLSATSLSAGSATIDASVPSIALGSATNYFVGTGIWMGNSSGTYKMHVGNPSGNYLKWDGTNLTISGTYYGTMDIAGTRAETFTINDDNTSNNVILEWKHPNGSAKGTWNGSVLTFDKSVSFTGGMTFTDLVPAAGSTYDLGSSTVPWRSLYVDSMTSFTLKTAEQIAFGGYMYVTKGAGNLAQDVSNSDTQIDFGPGLSIVVGDLIQIRSGTDFELVKTTSNVSNDVWNVTRNYYSSTGSALTAKKGDSISNFGQAVINHSGTLGAAVSNSTDTQINFGTNTIAASDFIELYSGSNWEVVQATSQASGNTWNVLRGMYGTAQSWSNGATWKCLRDFGNGRFIFDAITSGIPRMSIIQTVRSQAYSVSDVARYGGLSGWQGAGLTGYGIAIGNYAKNRYMYYSSATSKLVVRGEIYADSGALGTLTVSGSISSGATGYDTGTGWWMDYNGGTPRLFIGDANGNKLTWSGTSLSVVGSFTAGAISATTNGLVINKVDNSSGEVLYFKSSGNTISKLYNDYSSGSYSYLTLMNYARQTAEVSMVTISSNNIGNGDASSIIITTNNGTNAGYYQLTVDDNQYFYISNGVHEAKSPTTWRVVVNGVTVITASSTAVGVKGIYNL